MSELWVPPLISLNREIDWDMDLSLEEAADLVMFLTTHSVYDIRRHVLRELDLKGAGIAQDEARLAMTVEQFKALPNVKDIVRNRYWIQKGLAMELGSAQILRHLDKPPEVTAWARPKGDGPNLAAGPGNPDISIEFPETEQNRAVKILAEVKSKRTMIDEDFFKELNAVLGHARIELEKAPELLVYCLVVNGAKIHTDVRLHELYRGFLQKHSLTPDGNIRMVPMYSADFGYIAGRITTTYDLSERYFEPYVLFDALDAVCSTIAQEVLPEKRMWMIDLVMKVIEDSLARGYGLDDDLGGAPGM